MSVFQAIIANVKKVIDLPDSHFYDTARAGELSQNIKNGNAEYPAVLMHESAAYSSTINQDGIDLKNEIRTNGDFYIKIFSHSVITDITILYFKKNFPGSTNSFINYM